MTSFTFLHLGVWQKKWCFYPGKLLLRLGLAPIFKPGSGEKVCMGACTHFQEMPGAIEVSVQQSLLLNMVLQCLSLEAKEQPLIWAIFIPVTPIYFPGSFITTINTTHTHTLSHWSEFKCLENLRGICWRECRLWIFEPMESWKSPEHTTNQQNVWNGSETFLCSTPPQSPPCSQFPVRHLTPKPTGGCLGSSHT